MTPTARAKIARFDAPPLLAIPGYVNDLDEFAAQAALFVHQLLSAAALRALRAGFPGRLSLRLTTLLFLRLPALGLGFHLFLQVKIAS